MPTSTVKIKKKHYDWTLKEIERGYVDARKEQSNDVATTEQMLSG
jgi:hypothetical protein